MEASIKIERRSKSEVKFTINAPARGRVDALLASRRCRTEFRSIDGKTDVCEWRFSHDLDDAECRTLSSSLWRDLDEWIDKQSAPQKVAA